MKTFLHIFASLSLALMLTACGGGGDSSSTQTGKLNLSLTDAPVDSAVAVWITIKTIWVKGNGEEKRINIAVPDSVANVPNEAWEITDEGFLKVNLMALNNGAILPLFNDETLPAGDYQWVRFELVENTAYKIHNYMLETADGAPIPLSTPGNKNLLKTSGSFKVEANSTVTYVIDWDLRKSVVEEAKGYKLKPVLHIKRETYYAYVTGYVEAATYDQCAPDQVASVYVFNGYDATPDDMGGVTEPVITTYVSSNDDGAGHKYYVGPVDPGQYTFAFTCDSASDDPETDEVNPDQVEFISQLNVEMVSGSNSVPISL